MTNSIRLLFTGIILGIANVIPGVSGGTLAVVFNVYDRLIQVITPNVKKIFAEWKFWLPLAIGMAAGIFLFSTFISFLFERFPIQTNWFFIGIILGSVPMIFRRFVSAGNKTDGNGKAAARKIPPVSSIICVVVAFALMAVMAFANVTDAAAARTEFSFALALKLFAALALAAVSMIIPGISGSFLMLCLGVYSTIIAAVADLNIPLLIPAGLGAIAGLLLGAKLVRFLMARVPSQTYGAIFGLVLGSVLVIFPGFGTPLSALVSLVCAAAGFAVSFFCFPEEKNSGSD